MNCIRNSTISLMVILNFVLGYCGILYPCATIFRGSGRHHSINEFCAEILVCVAIIALNIWVAAKHKNSGFKASSYLLFVVIIPISIMALLVLYLYLFDYVYMGR
jgi:hypothetical protein